MSTDQLVSSASQRRRGVLMLAAWGLVGLGLWAVSVWGPQVDALWGWMPWRELSLVTEVWLLVGVLGTALYRYPRRRVEEVVGAGPLALILLVVAALLYGQYVGTGGSRTYPVAQWSMYTNSVAAVGYLDILVVDPDGSAHPLPIAQTVPTSSPRAFMSGLQSRVTAAVDGSNQDRQVLGRALSVIAVTGGHRDGDVVVRRCSVAHRGDDRPRPPSCEDVLEFDIVDYRDEPR